MTLRATIAADAITVFTRTDDFAETVTYYPHRYYGDAVRAPRSIKAVVERQAITVISQDGDVVSPIWLIHVANDATYGITSDELDTGGDQIEFPPRDGETAEKRTITQLLTQDHGMLVLECR